MTSEQIYDIYHYPHLPDPVARMLLSDSYGKSCEGIFTQLYKAQPVWLNALPGFPLEQSFSDSTETHRLVLNCLSKPTRSSSVFGVGLNSLYRDLRHDRKI